MMLLYIHMMKKREYFLIYKFTNPSSQLIVD